ncbi:amidohydrolase family protein [Longitalea luteola]|uniref:amidohydrolase family protein n=1 Tax=Longitalea luteola TaxID=2812563 RepID=UPI001A96ADE6|nr:amidohydrolase family protein [Longitalea luteola]
MRKFLLLAVSILFLQIIHAQHSILLKNVNIVDVEKGKLIKNANVLIRDSVIAAISTKPSNLKADTVIEGKNRYLIPGLWDMHVHIWTDAFFPLLLANGVTGVRDMLNYIQLIQSWRKKIASNEIAGPQIIASGPILDGPKPMWPGSVAVKDAADGKRAVDSLKNSLHTDFIKVYSLLPRDAYFAIAEEAKTQHIPFAGHVPAQITVVEAARAGQKSQEHLYGFLEAASDSADYYMQVVQDKIPDTNLKNQVNAKQFLQRTFNAEKLKSVLQEIKKFDTYVCPTLVVLHSMAHVHDTTRWRDPRIQFLPKGVSNYWDPAKDPRSKTRTRESAPVYEREFVMNLQIVKSIFDAGIPILAGTDFPNPYCFPGFGLHDELKWLVKAGLTPAQALQTATINPARYLDLQNQYGTVSAGKIADLILLDENPLSDISNTQKIQSVFVHGKILNRSVLNNMLETAKKKAGHEVHRH